jgi:hypothetical protein
MALDIKESDVRYVMTSDTFDDAAARALVTIRIRYGWVGLRALVVTVLGSAPALVLSSALSAWLTRSFGLHQDGLVMLAGCVAFVSLVFVGSYALEARRVRNIPQSEWDWLESLVVLDERIEKHTIRANRLRADVGTGQASERRLRDNHEEYDLIMEELKKGEALATSKMANDPWSC